MLLWFALICWLSLSDYYILCQMSFIPHWLEWVNISSWYIICNLLENSSLYIISLYYSVLLTCRKKKLSLLLVGISILHNHLLIFLHCVIHISFWFCRKAKIFVRHCPCNWKSSALSWKRRRDHAFCCLQIHWMSLSFCCILIWENYEVFAWYSKWESQASKCSDPGSCKIKKHCL